LLHNQVDSKQIPARSIARHPMFEGDEMQGQGQDQSLAEQDTLRQLGVPKSSVFFTLLHLDNLFIRLRRVFERQICC
jgi:hypothetical protein